MLFIDKIKINKMKGKSMNIDLSLLYSRSVDYLDISNNYSVPKKYFENYKEIINLDNIKVSGRLTLDSEDDLFINCQINGEMTLADSISLEPIKYPYELEIAEKIEKNYEKCENTLDIFSFLWENIVLEVPLQYTRVEDLSQFHGDGWCLISEEEKTIHDNPFSELLNNFNKEE